MSPSETRLEWGVRITTVLPRSDEKQAREHAAEYQQVGEPTAVVVRREVTVSRGKWEEVPDGAASEA